MARPKAVSMLKLGDTLTPPKCKLEASMPGGIMLKCQPKALGGGGGAMPNCKLQALMPGCVMSKCKANVQGGSGGGKAQRRHAKV